MEVPAKLRHARISARKARLVAELIRGKSVVKAIEILKVSTKKASAMFKKVLESAMANAENNNGADIDALYISKVFVDEGPVMKRMHARAKGRGNRILKRTSHITVCVAEKNI